MPINSNYNEEAIVEAIATALDNFYTNLISNIDKLNIKKVMKRKNPYLFRAKAMNGAAQIIDAILAAFVSSSEETIFGNVFFEPIATQNGSDGDYDHTGGCGPHFYLWFGT